MPLQPGSRLGPYEVVAVAGAGGMGEVYRSRDATLHRDVAIKILPDVLARDPDRLARFSREAQTLAALSHPNIAHIYGLIDVPAEGGTQVHALVMEWVEGEDLAQRLEGGAIPVAEALAIAKQIAEALESAHEQSIIHRDIKPANIKVKPDGVVKVLDFGLAKAGEPALAAAGMGPTTSPTMTSPALTAMGIILGTAAYMAPEQARGKPVDRRADIWAFGVVLTEMLTGRRVFNGETVSDVMVSVLSGPIDLSALPADVPRRVRELIQRCLERDPKRRLRDIGEARFALESAVPDEPTPTPAKQKRAATLPWIVAAASLAAAIVTGTLWYRGSRPQAAGERLMLEIGAPAGEELVVQSNAGAAVISPDGSMVTFLAQGSAGRRLYIRSLVTGDLRAVSGNEEASYPFWSPDSRSLAFFGSSKLFTVSIAGGLPEAIADIEQGRGGTWTDNGVILFTPRGGGVVHRVAASGGKVDVVTALDATRAENAHYWPVALPGGRQFLFFIRSSRPENNGIYLGSVDGQTSPVRLVTSLSSGLYAPPIGSALGHVLWVRDGELLAQPLDIEGRRLTGEVRSVASDVRVEESQRGNFASVSANGTIVWPSASAADLEIAWVSRDGRTLETLPIPRGKVMQPRISPDGRKLAFTRASKGTADIWMLEFQSGAMTQVTTDPGYEENPAWSSDSTSLLYNGILPSGIGTVITAIDGSRAPRLIIGSDTQDPAEFLPKRSMLIAGRGKGKDTIVFVAPIDDPGRSVDVSSEPGYAGQFAPSPDGQWLALVTDRTGPLEVVLRRLIEDGSRLGLSAQSVPVSTGGGVDAHWRADGREIVYLAPDRTLMAVSVTVNGSAVLLGKPVKLFRVSADAGGYGSSWTANADHSKFIVVNAARGGAQTFRVLTNWK